MRVFAAIDIPEELVAELRELAHDLRAHIPGKFMRAENYHITLAFIGEIAPYDIDRAATALQKAAAAASPVVLDPSGLGKFGRVHNATLWLGFAENANMNHLANNVRENLQIADIPFDQKPFKPHITIARHANISKTELPALSFPYATHASSITLYKSELHPDGAIYEPLETFFCGELAQ